MKFLEPEKQDDIFHSWTINKATLDGSYNSPFVSFFSHLYTRRGAWAHGPEIKSCMLFLLSEPGAQIALMSLNSLIFSSGTHLLLVPSSIFFISDTVFVSRTLIWVFFVIAVLILCLIPSTVLFLSMFLFYDSLLIMGHIFLLRCMPGHFWFAARHYDFSLF